MTSITTFSRTHSIESSNSRSVSPNPKRQEREHSIQLVQPMHQIKGQEIMRKSVSLDDIIRMTNENLQRIRENDPQRL
jgi:hypothetical protein